MNLPKVYEPGQYEADIYALWEKAGAFAPEHRGSKETFSIVVPPPNANGDLHIGHALTLALEDIAIRYQRMRGKATLFLPGADHAGFETQSVYEKHLAKEGKSRFDFTREELYSQIWDFVAQNRSNYESQFRKLGASLDWDRFVFTLDEKIVKQAYATFKKMWDDGLIYRGERLVNYCTFHGTAFADIEVVYKEAHGHLWHLKYPLVDGSGEITVATTRPETMLGDVAVAVHPDDKRYKDLVGKTVKLPLTEREIPIIADQMVDPEFGTGAVKITPAHDPNDFEVAERHDLPKITVIGFDGAMTHEVPEAYRGLEVTEARKKVVADLKEAGQLEKEESYAHSVGHCYKCDTVIQPLLKEQWFVDMKPLAEKAISALRNNEVRFHPEGKKRQLIAYLENLRDWNISRQIAWGIPIPAFQNIDDPEDWIYDERVDQKTIEVDGKTYHRDPEVFDTWFSSSSWPYATLDFPDSEDFGKFYPLSLMETGFDILFPWVSRMLMLGLYAAGEVPFKEVYLHGLVLDEHGQKMSKSKGNVVNPLDVAGQYGSDALRMGLITGQSAGNNQPFGEGKVVGGRNFCNKLWNIARFIESKTGDTQSLVEPQAETAADHWILYKLDQTIEGISKHLDGYRFSEAYETLYHFVWDDFADWYVEASKAAENVPVLAYCLDRILRLAHPFAPFVTETIWQTLGWTGDSLLITSDWPKSESRNAKDAQDFGEIQDIVQEVRFIKSSLNLASPALVYQNSDFVAKQGGLIRSLAKIGEVKSASEPAGLKLVQTRHDCWLKLDENEIKDFKDKLEAEAEKLSSLIKTLGARLKQSSYRENAPKHLVKQTEEQLEEAQAKLAQLKNQLKQY